MQAIQAGGVDCRVQVGGVFIHAIAGFRRIRPSAPAQIHDDGASRAQCLDERQMLHGLFTETRHEHHRGTVVAITVAAVQEMDAHGSMIGEARLNQVSA